jgi:hypothetical protein
MADSPFWKPNPIRPRTAGAGNAWKPNPQVERGSTESSQDPWFQPPSRERVLDETPATTGEQALLAALQQGGQSQEQLLEMLRNAANVNGVDTSRLNALIRELLAWYRHATVLYTPVVTTIASQGLPIFKENENRIASAVYTPSGNIYIGSNQTVASPQTGGGPATGFLVNPGWVFGPEYRGDLFVIGDAEGYIVYGLDLIASDKATTAAAPKVAATIKTIAGRR